MSKKMMTERQAWLYLARRWDAAKDEGYRKYWATVYGSFVPGICHSLNLLFGERKISEQTYDAMDQTVLMMPKRSDRYVWPRTKAGARQRAAFCRKQAARLEGK